MILFGRPHQVIKRQGGAHVQGEWRPAVEPAPVTLPLNVQPAQGEDGDMICIADPGSLAPDDIVLVRGRRFIVGYIDAWDGFGGAETAHDRCVLNAEIPKAPGEA